MNLPVWFDGQNINEALFCEEFLHERRIIFANGALILLRWEVRHLRFQFQHFQNVGDLPGDIVHGTEFQLVVNLPTDDRFVEACQMLDYIEYLADVLTVGDLEERVAVVDELMKEGKIAFIRDFSLS
mgnify:CR=1 FL=1